jgi:hypothetical protein
MFVVRNGRYREVCRHSDACQAYGLAKYFNTAKGLSDFGPYTVSYLPPALLPGEVVPFPTKRLKRIPR